jgi:hypothetical protein
MVFFHDFIIQELVEYLPFDIYNVINMSNDYRKIYNKYRMKRYWNFNETYSNKYINDKELYIKYAIKKDWLYFLGFIPNKPTGQTFFQYINSIIDTQKNLSIKIITRNTNTNMVDVSNLGMVNALVLSHCNYNFNLNGVKNLGNLHTLNLSNCYKITDEDVKYLGNVHTLDLSHCKNITNEGIKYLGNVHTLNLGCTNITDNGIKYLGKVNTLDLNNCNITDLTFLANVYNLNLNFCRNIRDVSCLIKIHTLDLRYCDNIIDVSSLGNIHTLYLLFRKTLPYGLKYLTNNHTLNIKLLHYNNISITNDYRILGDINKNNEIHFYTLDLTDCNITDEGLKYIRNVHSLKLKGCERITGNGVKYLGNVHTLNLSKCKIMNQDLKYIENVHTLNLEGCCKISNDGIKHLGNVHTLNLEGCYDITDEGIKYLGKCHILILDTTFTKNITTNCIMNLGNVYINCGYNYDERKTYYKPYGRVGKKISL